MVVMLLGLLLLSCEPNASVVASGEGKELLPAFVSYASRAEVSSSLKADGYSLRIVEEQSLEPQDSRPPFSVSHWAVDGYRLGDYQGTLELEFFNDRLMRVTYFPSDAATFVSEAIKRGWAAEDGSDVFRGSGGVRIRKGIDYAGRSYLAFEDMMLVREFDSWISRYSGMGCPTTADSQDGGTRACNPGNTS